MLLFVDDTFEELSLHGTLAEASVPPEAVAAVEEALKWQRKDFRTNFHLRLLQDLLNTPGIHGTEIPRYRHDLKVEKKGKSYRIFGTVSQEEVSADFKALLPLYLEFKKGEYAQFGAVPFAGSMSRPVDVTLELPKKPRRALVNVHFEVLAKD